MDTNKLVNYITNEKILLRLFLLDTKVRRVIILHSILNVITKKKFQNFFNFKVCLKSE